MPAYIEQFRLPRYREIPDVGLYLDQTVKYVNRYLALQRTKCSRVLPPVKRFVRLCRIGRGRSNHKNKPPLTTV